MEKKTKKLQLRKETIAVLNGQRMSHIVGGNVVAPDGSECPEGFIVEQNEAGEYICIPMDEESGIRLTIRKSCVNTNCDCWSKDKNNCGTLEPTVCF